MTNWFQPRNLFSSPRLRATAWVDRHSTSAPGAKEDRIETGHGFGRLAVERNAIWVTNAASRTVVRIDGRNGQVSNRADLRRPPASIAAGNEAIWVVCSNGWLWRFQPSGEGEGVARLDDGVRGLACDRESVWILHANGRLVSVDQATGEITRKVRIRRGGRQLLHADGVLLALAGSHAYRVATSNGTVEAEAKLPARGVRAALHDGALWIACSRRLAPKWGAIAAVDVATMTSRSVFRLPSAPRAIAAGAGHVWIACGDRGKKKSSIVRVNPGSDELTPWAESEWTIYDLAVTESQLLAATGLALAGPAAGMAGGGAGLGVEGHHGGHHGGAPQPSAPHAPPIILACDEKRYNGA